MHTYTVYTVTSVDIGVLGMGHAYDFHWDGRSTGPHGANHHQMISEVFPLIFVGP